MLKRGAQRKFIILPACLLVLNVVQVVLEEKLKVIGNPYWRTAAVMFMYLVGFSLVTIVIFPLVERWIDSVYKTSKKKGGFLGDLLPITIIGSVLFFVYYRLVIHGVGGLLPG
ncbi:MAG: hypothetical protein ACKE51_09695 [Methylococcaceae bacterium]